MRLTSGRASLTAGLAAALLFGAGATRLPAQQQQGGITGTVTDRAGGAPLASVRVTVLNTNRSAFTNQQGKYNLQGLPPGAYQLQASLIGYGGVTNSATVTTGQSATVDFALKAAAVSLDVVTVVTPAGEQRARESANATTNIDMTTVVANQTVTTFADAMSGRDAGVQVLQSGGTVGTGTRIRIRGQTSLSLSNEPVYYVDGVRVESGDNSLSIGTGGQAPSRINDINPEDIANVEVVKGPAAATLYGTQAANGVIRITTKHGVAGPARWRIYAEGGMLKDKNQYPVNYMSVVVRTEGNPSALVNPARAALASVDPDVPAFHVRTMEEWVSRSMAAQRFYALLIAVFAALALTLAAVGVYGVLSQAVGERTREIGLRMALGAAPGQVTSLVVRQGVAPAAAGLGLGLLGALAASRLLARMLFTVRPADLPTYVGVAALITAVALAAAWLPARRVARVDPLVALRSD